MAARVALSVLGGTTLGIALFATDPLMAGESRLLMYGALTLLVLTLVALYEAGVWFLANVSARLRHALGWDPTPPSIRRLTAWQSVGLIISFYASSILAAVLAATGLWLGQGGLDGVAYEAALDHPATLFCASLGGATGAWLVYRAVASGRDLVDARSWFLAPKLRLVLASAIGGLALAAAITALLPLTPISTSYQPGPLATINDATRGLQVLTAILMIVVAPIGEEILFRGAILQGLENSLGPRLAVIGSAMTFALMHYDAFIGIPVFAVGILLGGGALAVLRLRSGRIVPCIVAHATYNAFVLTMALA